MPAIPLSPGYRANALRSVRDHELDVLVVGGGVVGAGTALDAASRGLSVALVEARDWAAGTSSRSSKLIHGGLRYLEQFEFGLVREALTERRLLLRQLAPHLVRPITLLLPWQNRVWERGYIGAGVLLYDTMGGAGAMPMHRHLSRGRALREYPSLRPDAVTGAIRFYDAQVDDARFTMTLVRTAAQHGAAVLSRTRMTGLLREGDRIIGARLIDLESGEEITVRTRCVIGATGVWTNEFLDAAGVSAPFTVRASKGVHIVVPRDRMDLSGGLILRTEKSVLFVMPWREHWIIGTTDTDWPLNKEHPAVSRADVDYLLEHVNAVLREPLTRNDIEGVYAGLRPLLAGKSAETAQLSREHAVARPTPGLVIIAGGKFTTYRLMARDAVNAAVADLGRAVPKSATRRLPLVGAVGFAELWLRRHRVAEDSGLPVERVEHLLRQYGSQASQLLDQVVARPELGEPVTGAGEYLKAEALYAVTHEGALHLEDVLTRRTRISIEEWDRGVTAAEETARLIAGELGWDEHTINREIEHFRQRVDAERAAELQPNDASAAEARLSAGELVPPR